MTNQVNVLNVAGRVVENALGCEIVESRLLWLEFKTDQAEGFTSYHSYRRVCSECFSGIIQDLVENRGITRVHYLDSLVG